MWHKLNVWVYVCRSVWHPKRDLTYRSRYLGQGTWALAQNCSKLEAAAEAAAATATATEPLLTSRSTRELSE